MKLLTWASGWACGIGFEMILNGQFVLGIINIMLGLVGLIIKDDEGELVEYNPTHAGNSNKGEK